MATDLVFVGILLVIGAIVGWLASIIVKWGGLGLISDIIVGFIGAVMAGYLLPTLGISTSEGFIAAIINAVIGAVILLVIVRLGMHGTIQARKGVTRGR